MELRDGGTATGASASHAYTAPGTYSVTLTVTDDGGKTATKTADVVVAKNPAYAQDDFARTVANGWETADIGGAWTVSGTASRYSVGGGTAKVNLATGGLQHSDAGRRVERLDRGGRRGHHRQGPDRRWPVRVRHRSSVNATTDYRAKVRMGVGGVVTLYLARTDNGTETVLTTTTVAGLTYNAGDRLRVRFQVTGASPTTLQAKVWKDGAIEPTALAEQTTDATAGLQAAGAVGLYGYVSASTTNGPVAFTYDELWVGPVRP